MVDKNLEQRINTAISNATPDVLDKIYTSCEEQKGAVINMSNNQINKKRKWVGILVAAAILLVIGLGGFSANQLKIDNKVNSTVTLDVNPSISINVNAKEKVLSVEPRNDEGKIIIGDMDLKNTSLDVAVNALVGSMLQKGYLSDIQNAILVSVENDDINKGVELQGKLTKEIEQMFQSTQFESVVFGQTVAANQSINDLSNKYNISKGKASLIKKLIQQDSKLTFEELAPLTVHEIALIMESKGLDTKEVTRTGHASEKAYIGKEQALTIAYSHAKADSAQVKLDEIEFDTDNGIVIYEIEFKAGTTKYEYEINAITGEITNYSIELDDDNNDQNGNKDDNQDKNDQDDDDDDDDVDVDDNDDKKDAPPYIGRGNAKKAAYAHSNVKVNQVKNIETDFDYDNGKAIYEIEFETSDAEYEYVIEAKTGLILKSEKKDKKSNSPDITTTEKPSYIDKTTAKSIVLAHAGVTEADITKYEIELDKEDDDNIAVYEIEFKVKNAKYNYEVDAITGKVLESESKSNEGKKPSKDDVTPIPSTSPTSYLDETKVKELVFQHAGVDAGNIKNIKIKLDKEDDDNVAVYEIEFKIGKVEYEYEVDAITGSILKSQVEKDD